MIGPEIYMVCFFRFNTCNFNRKLNFRCSMLPSNFLSGGTVYYCKIKVLSDMRIHTAEFDGQVILLAFQYCNSAGHTNISMWVTAVIVFPGNIKNMPVSPAFSNVVSERFGV